METGEISQLNTKQGLVSNSTKNFSEISDPALAFISFLQELLGSVNYQTVNLQNLLGQAVVPACQPEKNRVVVDKKESSRDDNSDLVSKGVREEEDLTALEVTRDRDEDSRTQPSEECQLVIISQTPAEVQRNISVLDEVLEEQMTAESSVQQLLLKLDQKAGKPEAGITEFVAQVQEGVQQSIVLLKKETGQENKASLELLKPTEVSQVKAVEMQAGVVGEESKPGVVIQAPNQQKSGAVEGSSNYTKLPKQEQNMPPDLVATEPVQTQKKEPTEAPLKGLDQSLRNNTVAQVIPGSNSEYSGGRQGTSHGGNTGSGSSGNGFVLSNNGLERQQIGKESKTSNKSESSRYEKLVEQVQELLKQSVQSRNNNSIVLRLDPPELGNLTVKVKERSGQIFARVIPDSVETEQVLRNRLPELTQALIASGLRADQIHVSIGGERSETELFGFQNFFKNQDNGQGERRSELSYRAERAMQLTVDTEQSVKVAPLEVGWVA